MYFSQLKRIWLFNEGIVAGPLIQAKQEERKEVFEKIKQMYPVRWEHINFFGIFDFSEESLKNALEFNTEELFDFEIE